LVGLEVTVDGTTIGVGCTDTRGGVRFNEEERALAECVSTGDELANADIIAGAIGTVDLAVDIGPP